MTMSTVLIFSTHRRPAVPVEAHDVLEAALEKGLDIVDLVERLDDIDGDLEREPGGDEEPELGALVGGDNQVQWAAGGNHDLEELGNPRSR